MDNLNLKIEYIDVDKLTPYERNTRKHTDKDIDIIAKSIEKYGFNDAIGIWGKNATVVEGHGRLLAAKKLGMEKVPCVRLDHLTEQERREYAIAHNRSAEMSEWDFDILPDELEGLDFEGFDFGFDFGLENDTDTEVFEDDYDVEPPAEPKSKLGDIYQLGRHRLMCGDSTKAEDVERLMGGQTADLLLTDPPYNVALGQTGKSPRRRKDGKIILNDLLPDEAFREFLTLCFTNAKNSMKPGAGFYIWHADNEGYNFRGAAKDAGFTLRQTLIWVKNRFTLGRQDYQWQHEPCLYGWADGASHVWYSDRKQSTVLNFDNPTVSKEHPTMKPIALFDYQIKNSTKSGDIVLDLFGGSGTTIMAAEQDGRIGYLMELDPRYVDVIIDRYEKFTGDKATKIEEDELYV